MNNQIAVFQHPDNMYQWSLAQQCALRRIAVVPTMGALHAGHLSLIRLAAEYGDDVIVTIFVNPSQFGPNEDFAAYPRSAEHDIALCRDAGATAVFLPAAEHIYLPEASTWITENVLSKGLCGVSRPLHFRGVCTIVAKLFNITAADVAVFGQKDFQQVAVIKRMVRDLNFPIEIVVAPIVREPDSLAMSSRNAYLSTEERTRATGIFKALQQGAIAFQNGNMQATKLRSIMQDILMEHQLEIDYATVVEPESLREREAEVKPGDVLLIAAFCGRTRLIDNHILADL